LNYKGLGGGGWVGDRGDVPDVEKLTSVGGKKFRRPVLGMDAKLLDINLNTQTSFTTFIFSRA